MQFKLVKWEYHPEFFRTTKVLNEKEIMLMLVIWNTFILDKENTFGTLPQCPMLQYKQTIVTPIVITDSFTLTKWLSRCSQKLNIDV